VSCVLSGLQGMVIGFLADSYDASKRPTGICSGGGTLSPATNICGHLQVEYDFVP
jgi:hypothetical protein